MKNLRFSVAMLAVCAMILSMALTGCGGKTEDDGEVSWNVGATTADSTDPTGNTPVTPDNPDTPVNPENPDTPDNPDTPVTPDSPDKPVNPGPDKTDGPANPTTPNTPGPDGEIDYSVPVTIYVDSVGGSNDNDGLTEKTPFKTLRQVKHHLLEPGSKVLMKAGSVFVEQVSITSSGKPGKPIVYDMYGKGAKPIIDGKGHMAAVEIMGVHDLEMRNLQIVSTRGGNNLKRGIWLRSGSVRGAIKHLRFQNIDFHDFKSNGAASYDRSSAALFIENDGDPGYPNYYDDLLVEGCEFYDLNANGINLFSLFGKRKEVPTWTFQPKPFTPAVNVVIRNNIFHDMPGDGVWLSTTKGAVIENNVCYKTGSAPNTCCAGLWPHNSDDCVTQYNETYGNYLGGGDGQGLNVDINCKNCIVQYNYSHDNEGGFLLVCTDGVAEDFNRGTVVRYNVSQNDLAALISIKGVEVSGLQVYNNTFYTDKGYDTDTVNLLVWAKKRNDATFTNNIFINESTMTNNGKWDVRFVGNKEGDGKPGDNSIANVKFVNNVFYGKSPVFAPKAENGVIVEASNKIGVNPGLVNPGAGKIGRKSADCYKMKADSICRGAGVTIANNGGKDFFGNKLSGKTSIGAHQG